MRTYTGDTPTDYIIFGELESCPYNSTGTVEQDDDEPF